MTIAQRPLWTALVVACSASLLAAYPQSTSGPSRTNSKPAENIESLAREAANDFSRRDFAAAAEKYERMAALQPNSANILNNLAMAYHMSGRMQDALPIFRKSLRINPNLFSANLFLGIELVQLGQAEQAIAPLEKAVRLDGSNRDSLMALASAYYALKQYDRAAKTYLREITLQPKDADAWFGLGFCFEQVGNAGTQRMREIGPDSPYTQRLTGEFMLDQDAGVDAEEAFRRALAVGEEQGLHAALAFAHLKLGDISQARREFDLEDEKYPGSLEGKLGQAAVALERGDFVTAGQLLCQIHSTDEGYFHARLNFFLTSLRDQTQAKTLEYLRADPPTARCLKAIQIVKDELTSPESSINLQQAFEPLPARSQPKSAELEAARAANHDGRYSDCAQRLRAALPDTTASWLLLARCASLSGQFYAAFEASQSVLTREPRDMTAHFWQVEAARKLAQAAFQQAIKLKPDSWQGNLLLGDIYSQRKKWDQALSHYEAVTRLKPDNPGALLGIANVHWRTGDNPQAEAALKKALRISPDNPTANFILGDIYVRMRRFEEAILYLRKYVALGGGMLTAHGDLGKAYAVLKKDKEAIAELLLALPTDRSGELHYQLSVVYRRQGQMELAKQALAKSEELRTLDRKGQRERLDRAVNAAEGSDPDHP